MDELLGRARRELQPPWDELREARVLSRVQEANARVRVGEGKLWRVKAGLVALALAVVPLAIWYAVSARRPTANRSTAVTTGMLGQRSAEPALSSLLALADGSSARLNAGAEVVAIEQSASRVRLEQRAGQVRYEVRPDAARTFVVLAHGIEVRVAGTVFIVAVETGAVQVSVERGRVEVSQSGRQVLLAPGESVRLALELSAPRPGSDDADAGLTPVSGPAPSATVSSSAASATLSSAPASTSESVSGLLERADLARGRGDYVAAERAFTTIWLLHPRDPRAQSAAFSLGRLQRANGRFAAAAATFQSLRQQVPHGPLAEDAKAEEATAWALAGAATWRARQPLSTWKAIRPALTWIGCVACCNNREREVSSPFEGLGRGGGLGFGTRSGVWRGGSRLAPRAMRQPRRARARSLCSIRAETSLLVSCFARVASSECGLIWCRRPPPVRTGRRRLLHARTQ